MEELVDIVQFLNLEINIAFGSGGMYPLKAIRSCLLHLICYAVLVSPNVILICSYERDNGVDITDSHCENLSHVDLIFVVLDKF